MPVPKVSIVFLFLVRPALHFGSQKVIPKRNLQWRLQVDFMRRVYDGKTPELCFNSSSASDTLRTKCLTITSFKDPVVKVYQTKT